MDSTDEVAKLRESLKQLAEERAAFDTTLTPAQKEFRDFDERYARLGRLEEYYDQDASQFAAYDDTVDNKPQSKEASGKRKAEAGKSNNRSQKRRKTAVRTRAAARAEAEATDNDTETEDETLEPSDDAEKELPDQSNAQVKYLQLLDQPVTKKKLRQRAQPNLTNSAFRVVGPKTSEGRQPYRYDDVEKWWKEEEPRMTAIGRKNAQLRTNRIISTSSDFEAASPILLDLAGDHMTKGKGIHTRLLNLVKNYEYESSEDEDDRQVEPSTNRFTKFLLKRQRLFDKQEKEPEQPVPPASPPRSRKLTIAQRKARMNQTHYDEETNMEVKAVSEQR